jgi:hypothetical protein
VNGSWPCLDLRHAKKFHGHAGKAAQDTAQLVLRPPAKDERLHGPPEGNPAQNGEAGAEDLECRGGGVLQEIADERADDENNDAKDERLSPQQNGLTNALRLHGFREKKSKWFAYLLDS